MAQRTGSVVLSGRKTPLFTIQKEAHAESRSDIRVQSQRSKNARVQESAIDAFWEKDRALQLLDSGHGL